MCFSKPLTVTGTLNRWLISSLPLFGSLVPPLSLSSNFPSALLLSCLHPISITAVLSNKCGFQLQYQMIFCVWLLAFSPQLCEQLRRYNVVPALSDILQESVKEKVTRIILAALRVRTWSPWQDSPSPNFFAGTGAWISWHLLPVFLLSEVHQGSRFVFNCGWDHFFI